MLNLRNDWKSSVSKDFNEKDAALNNLITETKNTNIFIKKLFEKISRYFFSLWQKIYLKKLSKLPNIYNGNGIPCISDRDFCESSVMIKDSNYFWK